MTTPLEELDDAGCGPLYRRIESALRSQISRGVWRPGQALPSRRRLCQDFGTTRVTLDKAIHGLVREGLLSSAKGSGTFVSRPAPMRRFAADGSRSVTGALRVGVVLGRDTPEDPSEGVETDNIYVGPLFTGIRDGVAGRGVEITYARVADGDYLRFCEESSLDGIVVMTPTMGDLPMLRRMADAQLPYVAVGISPANLEDARLPCVDTDNRQSSGVAVRHLLDLGHRRIALVNLALSHSDHLDRMEGFLRAMAAMGAPVDPRNLVLHPSYDIAAFEPILDEWLVRAGAGHMPTALVACDYLMTLASLRALRRRNLRVPEDVSIIGFDDPLSAEHLTPPLTTVRQPVYQVGRRAVERLIEHLQGARSAPALHGAEILPSELVVRESTTTPHRGATAERTLILQ